MYTAVDLSENICLLHIMTISHTTNKSFGENAIPTMLRNASYEDYHEFIEERVKLMANKIRKYYESL